MQTLQLFVVARNGWSSIDGCNLTNVVIANNEEVIITPNSTVLGVRFERSIVKYLPNAIFKAFTNLEVVDVENSGLETLESADFEGADNLVSFYARFNKLKSLGTSIFKNAPNMQIFLVSYNEIEVVSRYVFDGATKIIEAHLDENKITSLVFESFKSLSALNYLMLQNNTCIDTNFSKIRGNLTQVKNIISSSNCSRTTDNQFILGERLVETIETNLMLTNQQLRRVKDSGNTSNSTKTLQEKVQELEEKEKQRVEYDKNRNNAETKLLDKLISIFVRSINMLQNNTKVTMKNF